MRKINNYAVFSCFLAPYPPKGEVVVVASFPCFSPLRGEVGRGGLICQQVPEVLYSCLRIPFAVECPLGSDGMELW